MKIKDFIQGRSVSYQTVRKYITNHPELFSGHTGKSNNIILDEKAIELLSEKYPLPKPIEVVEDTEARRQLSEAHQLIIRLQQQLLEAAPKIAKAEQNQYLLETALEEKEALQVKVNSLEEYMEELSEQAKTAAEEADQLKLENEAMKNAGIWQRIKGWKE